MASIRITQFAGISPEVNAKLIKKTNAQVAHNTLLWDGTLRPMPKWQVLKNAGQNVIGLYNKFGVVTAELELFSTVHLNGAPFSSDEVVGLSNNILLQAGANNLKSKNGTTGKKYPTCLPTPNDVGLVQGSTVVTPMGLSTKAMSRVYAITLVRNTGGGIEESAMSLLTTLDSTSIVKEGDVVNMAFTLDTTRLNAWSIDGVRLYRTMSGLDTGEQIANELDTDWHLVATLPRVDSGSFSYNDGSHINQNPLDLYNANEFNQLCFPAQWFGLTEGGWFVAASNTGVEYVVEEGEGYLVVFGPRGNISFSERYLQHAWPNRNEMRIPEDITSMAVHYDNVYIGTKGKPYIIAVSPGEGAPLQISALPYPEYYPCAKDSMVVASGGAMYASSYGIVSLSKSGQRVLTSGLVNPGDSLYNDITLEKTYHAAWYAGKYYGFVDLMLLDPDGNSLPPYGYIFDAGDDISGENRWQALVTCDFTTGRGTTKPTCSLVGPDGLHVGTGDGIYILPLPGASSLFPYSRAPKMCYTWKSKKFVFPGNTTFAAAKVVHKCDGEVTLKVYVDCCCVFTTRVFNCGAFMLPSQFEGIEWEVELIGTATVMEVHVAGSMEELVEHDTEV